MAAHDLLIAGSAKEEAEIAALRLRVPIAIVGHAVAAPDGVAVAGAEREKVIGFLRRYHPIKGVRELILAWAAVAAEAPGWRPRLVGLADDEDYGRELEALADRAERVSLEGPLFGDDKWRFLASCAAVAVPSRTENFCLVVAEAYLAGTPVVATTDIPWPQIEERSMGWRGEGSVSGLTALLRQAVAATDAERGRMGSYGRTYVEKRYAPAAIAAETLAAYAGSAKPSAP